MEVPDLILNGWFLDDGVQIGGTNDLVKVVHILLEDRPARGLHLSTRAITPSHKEPKSTIWCPNLDNSDLDPLRLGIPRIMEPGIILLGSPIGCHSFVQETSLRRYKLWWMRLNNSLL